MLHAAYEIGNPEVVQRLVSLGANTEATDAMGTTPLQHGRHHAEVRRRENRKKANELMVRLCLFVHVRACVRA